MNYKLCCNILNMRLDKLCEHIADVLEYGHHDEGVDDIGIGVCFGGSVVASPCLVRFPNPLLEEQVSWGT